MMEEKVCTLQAPSLLLNKILKLHLLMMMMDLVVLGEKGSLKL